MSILPWKSLNVCENDILSCSWEFGDGDSASGNQYQTVSHQYTAAGEYTVMLTVENKIGLTNTFERSLFFMPSISPSTYYRDFGPNCVGSPNIFYIQISNFGNANLHINDISIHSDSSVFNLISSGLCKSGPIEPGKYCELKVKFTPEEEKAYHAMLVVESDDWLKGILNIGLSGIGIDCDDDPNNDNISITKEISINDILNPILKGSFNGLPIPIPFGMTINVSINAVSPSTLRSFNRRSFVDVDSTGFFYYSVGQSGKYQVVCEIIADKSISLDVNNICIDLMWLEVGDFNENNQIDLADAIIASKIAAGSQYESNLLLDTNSDGKIGVKDSIYILQRILNLR